MIICGTNRHSQLTLGSNDKNVDGTPIINPPLDSNFDFSQILSFSIYNEHSVWISKNGQAHAIGDNRYGQILGNINQKSLSSDTIFKIEDKELRQWVPLSAVCGESYTLYLVSSPTDNNVRELVYAHRNQKELNPLFLNINDHYPVALFGGRLTAACIDKDGRVMIIRNTLFKNPYYPIPITSLPHSEKAVSVACCDKAVIALSSNGHLFECSLAKDDYPVFVQIPDLIGVRIASVSGSHSHFLSVSSEGLVFGRGSNKQGRLCMPSDVEKVEKFTVLESLRKYRIQSAFSGYSHSLFITNEGLVIACGDNYNGNLFLNCHPDENDFYLPMETIIKRGATFCITGWNLSTVFVDCNPPKNTPNKSLLFVNKEFPQQQKMKKKSAVDSSAPMISEDQKRIADLEKQVSDQKARIKKLEKELKKERLRADTLAIQSNLNSKEGVKVYNSKSVSCFRAVCELDNVDQNEKIYEVVKEESFEMSVLKVDEWNDLKQQKLIEEWNVLDMAGHPNIVKTDGFYFNKKEMTASIFTKKCQVSLDQAVMNSSLSNVEIVCSIYQIAQAMKYAHFVSIIHGNLTPQNIMIDDNGIVKVGDFGSSILRKQIVSKFAAPEIVKGMNYDEKADVYSFAMLCLFILSEGEVPKSKNIGKIPDIPDNFSDYAVDLISKCCNFDPKKRPTFNVICKAIELNDYELTDLNISENNEVKQFVENYKKQIPSY